ncbi:MAG TPA: YciI family protein [Nocardioidaceae bacterium]|jgi:hypothetical protein|nr:YciI family protein [Nocardioidaceae bacterium]
MQYAVLIYSDERLWTEASAEDRAAYHAAHTAFDEAVRSRAKMLGGEALVGVAAATTLRPGPGGARLVTDGPFAETAEQLGGFYLVDAPDLDTMVDLCDLLPHQYVLEVRPVADMSSAEDWLDAQP